MSTQTGTSLLDQGRYDEAKAEFQQALSLTPDDAEAYNGLGRVALIQGRYPEAERSFRKASAVNPRESIYHYNLGLALEHLKRADEAIEEYQKATELRADYAEAYYNWGNALSELKQYETASEKYQKATELNTADADAYYNWGNALFSLQQYEAACEKYQKATELNTADAVAYNNWGNALSELKQYEAACEKYQKATELRADYAEAYYNWGTALANLQQYEAACEKYQKATELSPHYVDAYYNWGNALFSLQQYEAACEKYQKAINLQPNSHDSYYQWGSILLNQKRYNEAIEKYKKVVEIDESFPYAYHNMAYILERQGRYKAANEEWKKACDAYDKCKREGKFFASADDFLYFGSVLHEAFRKWDRAEQIYKEGLKLDPNHIGILIGLVNLYLEEKDKSNDQEAAYNFWKTQQFYKKAGLLLKDFLKDKSIESIDTVVNRTIEYWKSREEFKKAERILIDRIKREYEIRNFLHLGQLQLKMEEYDTAEKNLKKVLELDSQLADTDKKDEESAEAHSSLGVIYIRKEDFKNATEQFEAATRRFPDNLTIRSNLAEVYLKAKQVNKAEVEYQKILRITSDHVESLIGLGEVYTALGEDGDGDMYQKAVEYFSLGKKKGESEESSKKLKHKELAALLYSRGYARVKLYEVQKTKTDEKQLSDAERDFIDCTLNDPDHYKAKRAQEKIHKRLSRFSTQSLVEWIGPWTVTILSLWVFLASQYFFVSGYRTSPRPVTDKATIVAERLKDALLKAEVQPETEKTGSSKTGDDKHGVAKAAAVAKAAKVKPDVHMGMGIYALLTFGSLIFMVAGLYLPQILKLKVAGIELEKSSVNQITISGTLGISK